MSAGERSRAESATRGANPLWRDVDASPYSRLARDILDCVELGYCILEVGTRAGGPLDLRFIDISVPLDGWGPLRSVQERWAREALPALSEDVYERLDRVALTGEATEFELSSAITEGPPVRVCAFRFGDPTARLVGVLVLDARPGLQTSGGP